MVNARKCALTILFSGSLKAKKLYFHKAGIDSPDLQKQEKNNRLLPVISRTGKGRNVPDRAQFDDRIRNLIELASDPSPESRALLFSHICDLFLQKRKMQSADQARMLCDILKELLPKVDIAIRKEVALTTANMSQPPQELIDLLSQDVVSVSGPILERAVISDDHLIHLIRYGSDLHRWHIGRRFGLSPLVRAELDQVNEAHQPGLKYSLSELEAEAAKENRELDEATTADILELVRAQNIHQQDDEYVPAESAQATAPTVKEQPDFTIDNSSVIDDELPEEEVYSFSPPPIITPVKSNAASFEELSAALSRINNLDHTENFAPTKELSEEQVYEDDAPEDLPEATVLETPIEATPLEPLKTPIEQRPLSAPTLEMSDPTAQITEDLDQKIGELTADAGRNQDFIRATSDWFWEIDRVGSIQFLSEEAFHALGRPAKSMIGEDFISLCAPISSELSPEKNKLGENNHTFDSLFERRSAFRDLPFQVSDTNGDTSLWALSGMAVFDISSGRFSGFRGSAKAIALENHHVSNSPKTSDHDGHTHHQEITDQKLSKDPEAFQDQSLTVALSSSSSGSNDNYYTAAYGRQAAREEQPVEALSSGSTALDVQTEDAVAADLLQNLSHEFRTPLNAIIGFSEMIDMETWGPVNEQYKNHIQNILEAAHHLKTAVNDVLDSAKLEAGLMEISPESFSLKTTLQGCLDHVQSMIKKHQVTLGNVDNNIDVIVYNDRQSIELCLVKMLTSLLKRAKPGEKLDIAVLVNSNAQVRIEIPILGPRIPEADSDKLFQRLEGENADSVPSDQTRTEKNHKKSPKISQGFGLSIARDLARLVGGDLTGHAENGHISHLVLTVTNHPHND